MNKLAQEAVPAEAEAMPQQDELAMERQRQFQDNASGGWVRLEHVIDYLQKIDQNKGGHDVKITATSDSAGSHKFEITVKSKPMMNKATGMGQVAASNNVKIKVAMDEVKPIELAKTAKNESKPEKNLREVYPNGFLKAMGLA